MKRHKRSKDRKIYGKCTNGTNRRSRVWPVCFIYVHAFHMVPSSSLSYNLGQNKVEQLSPNPPLKQWWRREGGKTRHFTIIELGEEWSRCFIYFVQDWILDRIKWNKYPPSPLKQWNLSTRCFLRGDGNQKSNLLPIHVSCRQGPPSRLRADFVLLILTSPVKREFRYYDFRAFVSFCLQYFAHSDT